MSKARRFARARLMPGQDVSLLCVSSQPGRVGLWAASPWLDHSWCKVSIPPRADFATAEKNCVSHVLVPTFKESASVIYQGNASVCSDSFSGWLPSVSAPACSAWAWLSSAVLSRCQTAAVAPFPGHFPPGASGQRLQPLGCCQLEDTKWSFGLNVQLFFPPSRVVPKGQVPFDLSAFLLAGHTPYFRLWRKTVTASSLPELGTERGSRPC